MLRNVRSAGLGLRVQGLNHLTDAIVAFRTRFRERDAVSRFGRTLPVGMNLLSDRALVRRARQGSRAAAGELFERHWPGAWRAAYGLTGRREFADDVAQDAFERAFSALDRFDERRAFAPWLHRIVVNRGLDVMRRERRLVPLDDAPEPVAADVADGDRALLAAVAHLSDERRAVCVLRYGLGYTPQQIAEVLDLPVGTVHSRLARALGELRGSLETVDV